MDRIFKSIIGKIHVFVGCIYHYDNVYDYVTTGRASFKKNYSGNSKQQVPLGQTL